MSKTVIFLALCLLLFSQGKNVRADDYDDCINGCKQSLSPCVDQTRLAAGNIQEEENMIAACEQSKAACIQACRDAEALPHSPPPEPSPDQSPNQ